MFETILLTGAAGMIGSRVAAELISTGNQVIGLDRKEGSLLDENYTHIKVELGDAEGLRGIFAANRIDRVIHLAALAHTAGVRNLSREAYYEINVRCAENVFLCAAEKNIPVLFISTADVYGFVKGVATAATVPHPVTVYGKTKYLAEQALARICRLYDIFRFAPVYTDEVKRDIQKRYYFRYPDWGYLIGKGEDYEFLSIETAAERMVDWCHREPTRQIFNVKNETVTNTAECLRHERAAGRAKHVLHFPRWMVRLGFGVIYCLTGKNKYTFLLNKAVHPLRTE